MISTKLAFILKFDTALLGRNAWCFRRTCLFIFHRS